MNPQQPTQLDPQIINLTKAIRQVESGGNFNIKGKSGEYGAYQFTTPTWNAQSAKFGINVPLEKATPQQQNEVAYKQVAEWKAKGYNVGQIASMWNAGQGRPNAYLEDHKGTNSYGVDFNTPEYAKQVATAYQSFKGQTSAPVQPNQMPGAIEDSSGVLAPYSPTDNGLQAGVKALINTPGSALNFAKGVAESANPISAVKNIGEIGSGFSELSKNEGVAQALWDVVKGLPKETYDAFVPQAIKSLIAGDTEGAARAATNDPFGTAAPLVLALEGGARLADRYATASAFDATGKTTPVKTYQNAFNNAVETVAKPVTAPAKMVGNMGTSIISHLTSLDPTTVSQVLKNPSEFSKIKQEAISRSSIAEEFGNAIDEVINQKKETGGEYNAIRESKTPVYLPEGFFEEGLNKYGINLERAKDGSITLKTDLGSKANPAQADINAIQRLVDKWGKKNDLTPGEFLNLRSDIADLAGFETGKNGGAKAVAKGFDGQSGLYGELNKTVRPQIKGLKELDDTMSPQIKQYQQMKKDFLNPDLSFKDGAANKIANAVGKGKENLLTRMEQISPGITKRIEVLKAVEDIKKAYGIKTGSYLRNIVEGGAIMTGQMHVLVAAILTHPAIAVQLIRGFGVTGKALGTVVGTLQMLAGDTSSLKTAAKVGGVVENNLKKD